MKSILVIAPEESSSYYLQALLSRLPIQDIPFTGLMSDDLSSRIGTFSPLASGSRTAVMGFFELLPRVWDLWRLRTKVENLIIQKQIQSAILMDFGGFNLRLLPTIYEAGIPCVYWVLPQMWIWRSERVTLLKKYPVSIVAHFRKEMEFLKQHGVESWFGGHSLIFCVKPVFWDFHWRLQRRQRFGFSDQQKVIGWLLGSRLSEIRALIRDFVQAASWLYRKDSRTIFVWVLPPSLSRQQVLEWLPNGGQWDFPWVIHQPADPMESLAIMDLAWCKSGTVSLQLALLGVPHLSVYRVHPLTAWWVRRRYPFSTFNLVNLLISQNVIPERLQEDLTPKTLVDWAEAHLSQTQGYQLPAYWLRLLKEMLPEQVVQSIDPLRQQDFQPLELKDALKLLTEIQSKFPFWESLIGWLRNQGVLPVQDL